MSPNAKTAPMAAVKKAVAAGARGKAPVTQRGGSSAAKRHSVKKAHAKPVVKKAPPRRPPAKAVAKVATPAQKAAAAKKASAAKAAAAKQVAAQKARALAAAKATREREARARAAAKEKSAKARAQAAAAKARAVAVARAKRERDARAKAAAREREVQRKAREKAAAEAKKQREIEAKRKAIEAERLRRIREIEHRNHEELKRQQRREAEERRRLEALERKMHSKPYGNDVAFLEKLRALLLVERGTTSEQIAIAEAEANEMLVDRERLEYDDEDGSGVASDIQRDQLKDFAAALRLKVDEIDVALARVDDGSYGRCDECFEPISRLRLEAQLPVFTCVSCRASV